MITFPTRPGQSMQMNAPFSLTQATEVHLIFHLCDFGGGWNTFQQRKGKEMVKANTNTHNAPV